MYKFIHNPHQQESREALQTLLNDPEISPQLEVIDFMEARKKYKFRVTPTLWKVENDKITIELEEKFTVKDIKNASVIVKDIEPSEEEKKRLDEVDEKTTILSCLTKLLPKDDTGRKCLEKCLENLKEQKI